ncbi:LOW QUALITY PROTEIN: clavesin-2-like [Ctenocephalides felis]|uniref:clavesin-2-like n=1 Tax=Ctenocephalides felis TaxID=7515 RepID=UPI000E6E2130|nr:clavesin-2-like [Ctenocephalides felis]XP_026465436.1 LOW QUALITY PROTEIN: clavesin-2-like [Ctenocephalides felis]
MPSIMAEYIEYDWGLRNSLIRDLQQPMQAADKKVALQNLKDLIGASIDFALKDKSCGQDDAFLTRFLYARKFNVAESFELILSYYSYRQRNPVLFNDLNCLDESVQLALRDGCPGVLPERDRRGRKVLVLFTSDWDYCAYGLVAVYRALLLTLEKLLEDKQNQASGFVVVVDWTDFSFRQSAHLNPRMLKLMIEGLQDCFPARFKGVHFIGQPWYVEMALSAIKPFLKDKTRERIYMHGNNLSTLHKYVTKDILPAELGGEGPSFNPSVWLQTLVQSGSSDMQTKKDLTYPNAFSHNNDPDVKNHSTELSNPIQPDTEIKDNDQLLTDNSQLM